MKLKVDLTGLSPADAMAQVERELDALEALSVSLTWESHARAGLDQDVIEAAVLAARGMFAIERERILAEMHEWLNAS
jgi:hypothetical protein